MTEYVNVFNHVDHETLEKEIAILTGGVRRISPEELRAYEGCGFERMCHEDGSVSYILLGPSAMEDRPIRD